MIKNSASARFQSVDIVRGLVMIIMALDHTRDLFHITATTEDPTNLATTTAALFFTRWITHLCAPSFVFLSGFSAWLTLQKKSESETRNFFLSRGLWLMFLEFTIVNFGIWFDIHFHSILLQVIFAIGASFFILGLLIRVNIKIIGLIGISIITLHNLLPPAIQTENGLLKSLYIFFFRPGVVVQTPQFLMIGSYPIIPWLGIFLTGFYAASFFKQKTSTERAKSFGLIGLSLLCLFIVIRFINIYGDPNPWTKQKTNIFSFLSFINVQKYAPSLSFCLLMLGIMMLLLSVAEKIKLNRFTNAISTYGKVPMFYYLAHWYLLHLILIVVIIAKGFTLKDIKHGPFDFGRPLAAGLELVPVYGVWLFVVIILYPFCKWYAKYKEENKQNKWLSYL